MRRMCLDCGALIAAGSRCVPCRARYRSRASRMTWAPLVKAQAGHRCARCGASGPLQAHHVVPLSRGGADTPANMVALCRRCHHEVHHGR